jgi:hypothetical protein
MHSDNEEKPTLAVVLSLCSGTLFLFFALILGIRQPWSLLMGASVLTILVSFYMNTYPKHQTFLGALIAAFSLISFLAFEAAAPWGHISIWLYDGETIYYGSDLSLHVFAGVLLFTLGIGGGTIALLHRFLVRPRPKATPEVFLKQCLNCGKNIPIAAEECQYCKTKQP